MRCGVFKKWQEVKPVGSQQHIHFMNFLKSSISMWSFIAVNNFALTTFCCSDKLAYILRCPTRLHGCTLFFFFFFLVSHKFAPSSENINLNITCLILQYVRPSCVTKFAHRGMYSTRHLTVCCGIWPHNPVSYEVLQGLHGLENCLSSTSHRCSNGLEAGTFEVQGNNLNTLRVPHIAEQVFGQGT